MYSPFVQPRTHHLLLTTVKFQTRKNRQTHKKQLLSFIQNWYDHSTKVYLCIR